MRAAAFALLGVIAYLVFLVANVPAAFVAGQVLKQSAGLVRLADARGTLWQGSAKATITPPRAAPVSVDALQWRWLPARLFAGEMAYQAEVATGSARAKARIARSFGGWQLHDVSGEAGAGMLALAMPLVATWQPEGRITLTAPRLAWGGRALQGEARLEWRDAATSLSAVKPLGTYAAVVKATGNSAAIDVSTIAGALRITGTGSLALPGRITFTGEAGAAPAQASALEALLNLMGTKRPDGAYALNWRAP